MAHVRQSRPDSGLGFQVKDLESFQDVPSSLGSDTFQQGGRFSEDESPCRMTGVTLHIHVRYTEIYSDLLFGERHALRPELRAHLVMASFMVLG